VSAMSDGRLFGVFQISRLRWNRGLIMVDLMLFMVGLMIDPLLQIL
jgi:hypothetical protein